MAGKFRKIKKNNKLDQKPNNKKIKEFKCLRSCGTCCSFTVIKTKNLKAKVKKEMFLWKKIETEEQNVDVEYFQYHGIAISRKQHLTKKPTFWWVFECDEEIKTKIVGDLKYFRIPLTCRHLRKDNKCKIYRRRPNVCKTAVCPLKNELLMEW